jgi:predicted lipoprotein
MVSVLQDSEGWIPKRVVSDFDAIIAEARAIREPLVTTMADIPNRQRFIGLLERLLHLKSGLGNAYGPAIGLSTGFSFADGD